MTCQLANVLTTLIAVAAAHAVHAERETVVRPVDHPLQVVQAIVPLSSPLRTPAALTVDKPARMAD